MLTPSLQDHYARAIFGVAVLARKIILSLHKQLHSLCQQYTMQNTINNTIKIKIDIRSEHSMILCLTHILGALALLWLAVV
jgi:hypothetical protein